MTNDRLLGLRDGIVRLRWRDYAHGSKKKVLRLSAVDFLQRFLLHVLPQGFHRVRHYGLLGNRHKAVKIAACRRYFGATTDRQPAGDGTETLMCRIGVVPDRCHACGGRRIRREPLVPVSIQPTARAPTRSRL